MQRAWAGVDIGKGHHHAVVIDPDGVRLLSRRVVNDETALLELIDQAAARMRRSRNASKSRRAGTFLPPRAFPRAPDDRERFTTPRSSYTARHNTHNDSPYYRKIFRTRRSGECRGAAGWTRTGNREWPCRCTSTRRRTRLGQHGSAPRAARTCRPVEQVDRLPDEVGIAAAEHGIGDADRLADFNGSMGESFTRVLERLVEHVIDWAVVSASGNDGAPIDDPLVRDTLSTARTSGSAAAHQRRTGR